MQLLIGIDDTDNLESRGTGFKARQLAGRLEKEGLAFIMGITRHQLFVHDDIAYTSRNSSACLEVESMHVKDLIIYCSDFLMAESAEGSDSGLCVADWEQVNEHIIHWGNRAKREVLTLDGAAHLAADHSIVLKGFTGTKIGQIGALAAVGLRKSGNDGRFIWLSGTGELRDFYRGIYKADQLKQEAGIQNIQTETGEIVPGNDLICCDGWTRPILLNNMSVLLVEKTNFADYGWKTSSKEHIRRIS